MIEAFLLTIELLCVSLLGWKIKRLEKLEANDDLGIFSYKDIPNRVVKKENSKGKTNA